MKYYLSALITLSLFGGAAFAHQEGALVTKTNHPGHVLPAMGRVETCEVFQDRVVIRRQFGFDEAKGFRAVEVREVKITGEIEKAIEAAAGEKLVEKENMLCDGPSTFVNAGDTVLFSTGGCGNPRKERNGASSSLLRALVDNYCPVTHNVGVGLDQ